MRDALLVNTTLSRASAFLPCNCTRSGRRSHFVMNHVGGKGEKEKKMAEKTEFWRKLEKKINQGQKLVIKGLFELPRQNRDFGYAT